MRGELEDSGVADVELAAGGPPPTGTKSAEALLVGALTLNLLPTALGSALSVMRDWASRRPGRTLQFEYGAGPQYVRLEYDPDKTDINQLLAQLLLAQAAEASARHGIGGDKTTHTQAGGDAVGRDKLTTINVAPGSTLIVNDPALAALKAIPLPGAEPPKPGVLTMGPTQSAAPAPAVLWSSIILIGLGWCLSLAIAAGLSQLLWGLVNNLLPDDLVNRFETVVTWVLAAAIGSVLTGEVLRRSLRLGITRKILLLTAAAAAGAAVVGWFAAVSLESQLVSESLGLAITGAIAGYAIAAACGLSLAVRRGRPALLIAAGWALGLGLANQLGLALLDGNWLISSVSVAVTFGAVIGLLAGLIGGAATVWQLARNR